MIQTEKNPAGVFKEITAAVDWLLEVDDVIELKARKSELEKAAQQKAKPEQFVFFAAFDGTYNDRQNLKKSNTRQKTNVAMLYEQANSLDEPNPNQKKAYYAGVGTGGHTFGGFDAASTTPTPYVVRTAKLAYQQFVTETREWLKVEGRSANDVSAAITGFSRGAGTAVLFARMLNDGLMPDGTPVAAGAADLPAVKIVATLLFDPVFTGIYLDLRLPANIKKNVVVLKALDEFRSAFRAADFGDAPAIQTIGFRGNHGNIGGFYDNGIGALVLEGATTFFKRSGIAMANVPDERRFVDKNVFIYNESWDREYNNPKKWTECTDNGKRMSVPVDQSRYGRKRADSHLA